MTHRIDQAKALASEARAQILEWLKEPRRHFGHQVTDDPNEIGVCVTLLAEKLKMSQPTVSRHLDLLRRADFVTVRRIGKWSFFARDEAGLSDYRRWIHDTL